MWDLDTLYKAPATYPALGYEPKADKALYYDGIVTSPDMRKKSVRDCEVKSLLYQGLPFEGRPTRVFAYYGRPSAPSGTKLPAMVLVHGGGGTAFESWVRLWNARGYAAIAMDVCGCAPEGMMPPGMIPGGIHLKRHDAAGPAGWGGFEQIDWPVRDQWTYHAVADIVLANSLIRSFAEVDPERVGITGISWGGYLTCIIAGVDKRLKFAVPVYGCGFLGDNSTWLPNFAQMGKEKAYLWLRQWDPSEYLKNARMPMLWVTGTNDFAYPMDSLQKSYRLPSDPRTLCVRVRMPHGHGGPGETPDEIRAFADSLCKAGKPLPHITAQGRTGDRVWASFESESPVASAELNFTRDTCAWAERNWEAVPATIEGSRVRAVLPAGTRVYYLNLCTDRKLIVSTETDTWQTGATQ